LSKLTWFAILVVKLICGVTIIVSSLIAFYTAGPGLETKYWPVVSKLQVLTEEVFDGNSVKIRVQFTKLRDCDYIGMAWYVGVRPDDFERVAVQLMREPGDAGSPNRPLGTQRSGPWILAMTQEEFRYTSFARLEHRCHPFWTSITDFYP